MSVLYGAWGAFPAATPCWLCLDNGQLFYTSELAIARAQCILLTRARGGGDWEVMVIDRNGEPEIIDPAIGIMALAFEEMTNAQT